MNTSGSGFKTDSLNEPSWEALLLIGAKEEAVFRNPTITFTGRIRHSVYYRIIDSEWPEVRAHLEQKLEAISKPSVTRS